MLLKHERLPLILLPETGSSGDRRPRSALWRRVLRLGPAAPRRSRQRHEIRAFCEGQIAHYKIPRYVKFVDGFPMTVTGKIQKFVMREETIAELGLQSEKTA